MSGKVDLSRFSKKELQEFLWRSNNLNWLLHAGQKELSEIYHASTGRKFVANCSRRWGKSRWLCVESVQVALKAPKQMVRYAAPTAKMVKNIIEPHMASILETCPEDLKPKWHRQDGVYRFGNGSEIHLVGCDNGGDERLRGTDTHFAPVDEAGLIVNLDYVIQDILLPQTLTTNGRILLASTPPKTPGHPFHHFYVEALAEGRALHRTIYDAPHISPELVEEFIQESGGENTSTWKREYLAQFVVDDTLAVVPEWSTGNIIRDEDVPVPIQYDWYVSMDVGYSDLTVALLAFYDFATSTCYVVDEVVMSQSNSRQIDTRVAEVERLRFPGKVPVRRIVDAPPLVVADLRSSAGRAWTPARKDDKDAALNDLRVRVQRKQFVVHERCKTTIAHMANGIWNASKTSFERSGTYGHFDAIDAAKYLVRHLDWHKNPYGTHTFSRERYFDRPPKEDQPLLSLVIPSRRRT